MSKRRLFLVPRLAGHGKTRIRLNLSSRDYAAFNALPPRSARWVTVTDTATGCLWQVRRASCGLNCYCDALAQPAS